MVDGQKQLNNIYWNKAMKRMPDTSLVAWVNFMAWNVSAKKVS